MRSVLQQVFLSCISLFAFLAAYAQNGEVKLLSHANGRVQEGQKVEIGVQLPADIKRRVDNFIRNQNAAEQLNPFDPDQLLVEAVFEQFALSDTANPTLVVKVDGFYYEEFRRSEPGTGEEAWQKMRNDHIFRIRFTPFTNGRWRCRVALKEKNMQPLDMGTAKFTCVPYNLAKGPVLLTPPAQSQTHRYLQYSRGGEMFFPVGMNLVWAHLDEMHAGDHLIYDGWLNKLSAAGANYIQLSMLPFTYGVEWETPNNYTTRMKNAWEMDQLLEQAQAKGMQVNMLLLIHDEFLTGGGWIHKNNHWTNNGYNASKNGGITNAKEPLDFFTDAACKAFFKKRLRYVMARYGYATNMPILELLSEVDNAIPGYNDNNAAGQEKRRQFKAWFVEMKNYIQQDLGYAGKMVSASYAQGSQTEDVENRIFSEADVILLHFYGRHKTTNLQNRFGDVAAFARNPLTRYKPVIFDEMGANVFPGLDQCTDITFHNNLWATSMMGCFGTGQNWWWDNAVLMKGYEKSFTGIKEFTSTENYTKETYTASYWLDRGSKVKNKTRYEAYMLSAESGNKVVGWLHNTSFWWANVSNDCINKFVQDNNGSLVEKADNSEYGDDYKSGNATGKPQVYNGYQLKLKMPAERTEYMIKWYDTQTGRENGISQVATSSSSGKIKFDIPEISPAANPYGALGFKIVKYSK